MTSGVFTSVPIDSIWVDRASRQRRELKDIPVLAESIRNVGLINPPVARFETNELIAGERRWEACKSLGWTHIPVQWAENLPEHELKAIELEENIKRSELSWADQCRAVQEYHDMRSVDPDWNQSKTAEALGYEKSTISHILSVADELTKGNPLIVKAETFSVAKNIVQRTAERRKASILNAVAETPKADAPIVTDNFLFWRSPENANFNLIHCDFPYGINADNQDQGNNVAVFGGYKDGLDLYTGLLDKLRICMSTCIADSAHLIFWFAMEHYQLTLQCLEGMGWKVNPYPLVWWKSDNTGLLPDPARSPRRVYETAFMASRGDRKIISAVANVAAAPVTKDHHMSEKPLSVLSHFFRMVVDEYTSILDPTCGSGNALIAAKKAGASNILGIEVNPEFADRARLNWRNNIA